MPVLTNETVRVYDEAAPTIARHMSTIGSRLPQIEHAFALAGNPVQPFVVEIGCGDGRDAVDITKLTSWYEGFDPSAGLIELARQRNIGTGARFVVKSALDFHWGTGGGIDVIFAFASLLHLDRSELKALFERVAPALSANGVIYMTLKEADQYEQRVYDDDFELPDGSHVIGHRVFYYYTQDEVLNLAKGVLEPVFVSNAAINGIPWLTMAFKRA